MLGILTAILFEVLNLKGISCVNIVYSKADEKKPYKSLGLELHGILIIIIYYFKRN